MLSEQQALSKFYGDANIRLEKSGKKKFVPPKGGHKLSISSQSARKLHFFPNVVNKANF